MRLIEAVAVVFDGKVWIVSIRCWERSFRRCYYFDSSASGSNGEMNVPNTVRAVAFSGPTLILNSLITVSWNQFHTFSITRTSSQVTYFIDGQQVAQAADNF